MIFFSCAQRKGRVQQLHQHVAGLQAASKTQQCRGSQWHQARPTQALAPCKRPFVKPMPQLQALPPCTCVPASTTCCSSGCSRTQYDILPSPTVLQAWRAGGCARQSWWAACTRDAISHPHIPLAAQPASPRPPCCSCLLHSSTNHCLCRPPARLRSLDDGPRLRVPVPDLLVVARGHKAAAVVGEPNVLDALQ